ncbi:MAG: Co2+/Mg2+ efflux protein ApaG [bacterium]
MSNTDDIRVDVRTAYIEDQSNPDDDRYVFAYTINIKNIGDRAARLLNRHWVITDSNGKVEEVRGEGVVGEQPHLQPGESFEYTSGAILETPVGAMEGEYEMIAENGDHFLAPIQAFSLSIPNIRH